MIVIQIPSNNYPSNTRSFGPANVAIGVTKLRVTFTRENWPGDNDDRIINVKIEGSLDGGVTYPIWGEIDFMGGVQINSRTGQVVNANWINRSMPEPNNPNRKVRATIINNQTLRTAVTLETF